MCQRPEWDGPKTRPSDGQLCCHWRWVLHVVQTPQTKKDIFKRMTKRRWYVVTFNAKKYVLNSLLLRQWEAMTGNDPIRCRFEPSIFWMIWTNKSILNTYIFLQRGNYVGTENKFLWSKKGSQTCAFTSQHNIYIYFFSVCFSDLHPCLTVHCPSFGVCKAYSAHETRCVCFEDCPTYQDPVCTANGTTYDNKCWHELSYCKGLDNNLVYHLGSCEG